MERQLVGDKYHISRVLGEGGVGTVYLAEHRDLKITVAIKVLKKTLVSDPVAVERFRREAMAASRLEHPNIVRVRDIGRTHDGSHFLVMDYVRGSPLRDVLAAGPLPLTDALEMLLRLADALAYAHDHGVVHRDFKPDNILIRGYPEDGVSSPMVLDFGLAKFLSEHQIKLTVTGELYGTPEYMAPEQAEGSHVDQRSDIYSFGALAYEALTGRTPFLGNFVEQVTAKRTQDPLPPSVVAPDRQIPPELDRLVLKCLARDPESRYRDGRHLLKALQRVASQVRLRLNGGPGQNYWEEYEQRWCGTDEMLQVRRTVYDLTERLASDDGGIRDTLAQCLADEYLLQGLKESLCQLRSLRSAGDPPAEEWSARLAAIRADPTQAGMDTAAARLEEARSKVFDAIWRALTHLREELFELESQLNRKVGLVAEKLLGRRHELQGTEQAWRQVAQAASWKGWSWPEADSPDAQGSPPT